METPYGELPDRHLDRLTMADADTLLRRNVVTRRRVLQGTLAATAAGPVLWSRPGLAAVAPEGEHLAFGADASREATVSWSTPGSVSQAMLDLGLTKGYGLVLPADSRGVAASKTVYHHAGIRGLRPDTTYHYRLRHRGGAGPDRTFRTAPARPRPFRFTAFGDQGVGAGGASTVARVGTLAPAFHVHAGDLCYANSSGSGASSDVVDGSVWDRWFAQNRGVAARTPWMPAAGNHEMEYGEGRHGYGGFASRFALPATGLPGAPHVYWFRYANVAVVALDGNDASHEIPANRGWLGNGQDAWLRSTLKRLRADKQVDFVVVAFHHCMYCSNAVHASDGGVRTRWQPIFDQHQVDLVVNGHNHSYERTHPMRAGQVTREVVTGTVRPATDGTTYVTAGGGGQTAYPVGLWPLSYVTMEGGLRVPEPATWSAVRHLDLSLLVADVDPGKRGGVARMRLRGMKPDGTVLDDVTLERPARAAT